jgi:hypothetical protein
MKMKNKIIKNVIRVAVFGVATVNCVNATKNMNISAVPTMDANNNNNNIVSIVDIDNNNNNNNNNNVNSAKGEHSIYSFIKTIFSSLSNEEAKKATNTYSDNTRECWIFLHINDETTASRIRAYISHLNTIGGVFTEGNISNLLKAMSNLGHYIINYKTSYKSCYSNRNSKARVEIELLINDIWHVLDVEYKWTSKKPPYPHAFTGSAENWVKEKNGMKQIINNYRNTVDNLNIFPDVTFDVGDLDADDNKFIFTFEMFNEKIGPLGNSMYNNLLACWNFLENRDSTTMDRIEAFLSALNHLGILTAENTQYLINAMYSVGLYLRDHRPCKCHRNLQVEAGLESLIDGIWSALDNKYHYTSKHPPYPHGLRGAEALWALAQQNLPHINDELHKILEGETRDLTDAPYDTDGYEKCFCFGPNNKYVDHLRMHIYPDYVPKPNDDC